MRETALFITILIIAAALSFDANAQFKNLKADKFKGSKGGKQFLIGNVRIDLNNGMTVFCDKAEVDRKTTDFDAQGHVHVINKQLNIYSDVLTYDGTTKKGKFRKNVKLVDEHATLTTEFLDYDAQSSSGFFYNGGEIIDTASTLVSRKGYYYPNERSYVFVDSVVVHNDDYILHSDTLKYKLDTEIVSVFGPSTITGNSNFIYCENGWYDTKNNIAQFYKNAYLKNNLQRLTGDSLYYDRNQGIGKAFSKVELWDSTERVVIRGNYAFYKEQPEYAIVTNKAVFIQASETDSIYLHADTLMSVYDSTGKYQTLKAFYKAQLYKSDFQARADSISYAMQDSVIRMFRSPILWADDNQISADKIEAYMKNNVIEHVEMQEKCFLISREEPEKFNQVKGKEMTGYFKNNDLYRVDVEKNGNSVYYARDSKTLIGVNKSECSKMNIYLKNRKVNKVVFLEKPVSTLYPLQQAAASETKLEGFSWLEKFKPKTKNDIFLWKETKKE